MLYEKFLRPLLFKLDPEDAHEKMTALLSLAGNLPLGRQVLSLVSGRPSLGLETTVFGLTFPNPIGLAAGFDKDARLAHVLPALGFGFIEVGSVTLRPQAGNPRPRLFRLPAYSAIINRMGFNGGGVDAAVERLSALNFNKRQAPVGINIGLNKDTAKEDAPKEYAACFRALRDHGDYFAVNVSSPNTPGLRDLQERLQLEKILTAIQGDNKDKKPVLVKISPDLSDEQLPDLVGLIERMASGIIVSNTTITRPGIPSDLPELQGGLSGAPLSALSTALIRKVHALTQGRLPIIGVGGVMTGADAFEKLRAGASLVELYTGLVYRGPSAAVRITRELLGLMRSNGYRTVAEVKP